MGIERVTISLDKDLLVKVDDDRGDIKRSTFIAKILRKHYEGDGKDDKKGKGKKTKRKK